MLVDPIIYRDLPGDRLLDLRPDGVDCIPALGSSVYRKVREGTEEHHHPGCVEIVLNLRGRLVFESMGREYPFMPGTVFVSTPSQPHRMRHNPKGLMIQRILFRIPKPGCGILGFSTNETKWLSRALTHLPSRNFAASDKLKSSFAALFEIYDNERRNMPSRRLKMKTAAANLLVSVVEAARIVPARTPEAVADIAERISARPEDDYRISELAKETGFSAARFFKEFKRETGLPPHAYLVNCRIREAQRMLEKGSRSIDALADMLRFSSRQHFSTAFKRTVGIPPAEYRNMKKSTYSRIAAVSTADANAAENALE